MWFSQGLDTGITLIKNYLMRKNPGTMAGGQKWDFIQFNNPSQSTNYMFCNYYSVLHFIELRRVTHLIIFLKAKWAK